VALCGREGRQQKTRGQGKGGEADGKMGRKGKKEGRTCSIDSRGIDAPGRWGGCGAGGGSLWLAPALQTTNLFL